MIVAVLDSDLQLGDFPPFAIEALVHQWHAVFGIWFAGAVPDVPQC